MMTVTFVGLDLYYRGKYRGSMAIAQFINI